MAARAHRTTLSPAVLVVAAGLSLSALAIPAPGQLSTRPDEPVRVADAKPQVDIPIRKITLYRSGVGYFERAGMVDGNAEVTLRFNTEQINDILKSMVLLDLGGGRIDSVSYSSKEPLAKRLASFGINIADNPAAGEILQRLRGTAVSLASAEGEVSGTIMNVETRPTVYPGAGNTPATVLNLPWINLVTDKGVRSINLTNITGFRILDKGLAEELEKALAALAEYRADRSKTVDLRFTGAGSRQVVVGYVNEMPVWKASYRLVLPETDPPVSTDAKPINGQLVLQGWAIVENTTDQDWNGVRLSLVSGRPVSFQMDLYEPLFAFRPIVPVPTIPGVSPRIFGLGIDEAEMEDRLALGRSEQGVLSNSMQSQRMRESLGKSVRAIDGRGGGPGAAMDAAAPAYTGITAGQLVDYSPKAAAQAASVGEVFQFQVDAPVSIERQRSAMIPIISTNVTGRRVSIYNQSDGSQFPMRGVEITNDSKLQLLPGPISVIDGAAYAGDAQIGHIPTSDKRLLAYALDLDVAVFTKPQDVSNIEKIVIVDGAFRQTVRQRITTQYEFANKDAKRGRTIILEHPKRGNFDLVETEKPTEQTPDLHRFTVAVEAGKAKKFVVHQEQVRHESVGVMNWDMPTVVAFHKSGKMSDKVFEAYKQVAARQAALAETERQIADLNTKMKEISDDQSRIRENITRIDRGSQLATRYMAKLTEQETQLEDMRDKREKAEKQREQQRHELQEFVRNLTIGE